MKLQIDIPGDFGEEIVQSVVKFEGAMTKETTGVINQALLAIETKAKTYVPVDTGRLRSSIHAVPVGKSDSFSYDSDSVNYDGSLPSAKYNEGTTIGMVGTNVEYAPDQEFGNGKLKGHKYLTRATAEIQSALTDALKKMKL